MVFCGFWSPRKCMMQLLDFIEITKQTKNSAGSEQQKYRIKGLTKLWPPHSFWSKYYVVLTDRLCSIVVVVLLLNFLLHSLCLLRPFTFSVLFAVICWGTTKKYNNFCNKQFLFASLVEMHTIFCYLLLLFL